MRIFFLSVLTALSFYGCSDYKYPVENPELDQLRSLSPEKVLYPYEAHHPRFEMIRDAALSYSAQCSLRHHYEEINKVLLSKDRDLKRVFNFQPLLLEKDVVPPVIALSGQTVEKLDDKHLVIADRTFKILKHGFFATYQLDWQHYLIVHLPQPALPEKSFLPQDSVEKEIWARYVEEGWNAGKEQAFLMFQNNLGALSEDYKGMVNFHRLYQQGLISAPLVQEIENGVTVGKDQMNVNQKIITIVQNSLLENDSRQWHSYLFFVD